MLHLKRLGNTATGTISKCQCIGPRTCVPIITSLAVEKFIMIITTHVQIKIDSKTVCAHSSLSPLSIRMALRIIGYPPKRLLNIQIFTKLFIVFSHISISFFSMVPTAYATSPATGKVLEATARATEAVVKHSHNSQHSLVST
jgi:hypothetical protein